VDNVIRMPHLLAARTYAVLAVASLLGLGGGALLVAVDSPSFLFYVLGVLLVGLYTLQALRPGVGIRPLRKGSTEPSRRYERTSPTEETQEQPPTGAEPPTGAAFSTVNFGLAGGWLDSTEQVERARKTIQHVHDWGTPIEQKVGHGRRVYA
jgi:uncharacterized membrane protein YfcA